MIWALAVGAYQVWSGFQQAEMIEETAKVKQKISDMNSGYAEQDAFNAEAFGMEQTARYEAVLQGQLNDQRLALASQNIDLSYGTAKQMQTDSRLTGMMNSIDIQRQGRERAMGFKREARNIRLNNSVNRLQAGFEASQAINQGVMSGASTAVSGYSKSGA